MKWSKFLKAIIYPKTRNKRRTKEFISSPAGLKLDSCGPLMNYTKTTSIVSKMNES